MANTKKKKTAQTPGADFADAPGLHQGKIRALFSTPDAFVSMCQIVREDESTGYMEPTHTQKKLLKAYAENNWLMVNKFRQAKITTISVMLLLRDWRHTNAIRTRRRHQSPHCWW